MSSDKKVNPTAIVFSFDEAFSTLGKGLILSILEQTTPDEFELKLVDIGCSEQTISWMEGHGIAVKKFERKKYYPKGLKGLKSYQDAELCRPHIPELFPGYEIYLWCDTDLWVQNISSLRVYRDAVRDNPATIAISPLVDASYQFYYQDAREFVHYSRSWFAEAYGETIASTYGNKAIFSAGVLAMHASNPIWKSWATEVNAVFRRPYSVHAVRHVAEQVALNYLVYAFNKYTPLEAIHNYNCHIGCAVRRNGRVVLNNFPFREVGIVHLTLSGRKMKEYIEGGLLYQEGKYLSADELNKLATVAHY
jgi:hypothetical protein